MLQEQCIQKLILVIPLLRKKVKALDLYLKTKYLSIIQSDGSTKEIEDLGMGNGNWFQKIMIGNCTILKQIELN